MSHSSSGDVPDEGRMRPFTHEHYRTFFDSLDVGLCTIQILLDDNGEPVDYLFLEVNRAFERQCGLIDAVGRRMREMVPDHDAHWFRLYGQVALTGEPLRFEERAEALGRWFDVYAFRIGDPAHRLVAVQFSDTSARRRTEEALRQSEADEAAARREVEQTSRAKDEFLAMLGHELRNPLAPMLTALELMRLRGTESREQDVLERQVQHLTRMVDDLLDVSRIAQGTVALQARPLELCEVVGRAMELASPMLEQRRNDVDVQVTPGGLGINGDRERLAQVVSNLLTNASKYSDTGSRIVVSASRTEKVVTLAVRDQGIGINPEMLVSVFDAFVQHPQSLERSGGGLGLGLAIVRNLVAAHQGRVYARSDGVGRGSEFVVELPALALVATDSQTAPAAPEPCTPSTSTRRRVLVVDDNEDAAHMLQDALTYIGYEVEVAFDGPSALARVDAFLPDTVLLDIGLPVMDGYEVARRLRARHAPPPHLVALTGYGQGADRRRARDAGFQQHMVKPIDFDRLQQILDHPETSGFEP